MPTGFNPALLPFLAKGRPMGRDLVWLLVLPITTGAEAAFEKGRADGSCLWVLPLQFSGAIGGTAGGLPVGCNIVWAGQVLWVLVDTGATALLLD